MAILTYRGGMLPLTGHTAVMGILNVTPDSFSDGGRYIDPEKAAARALEMETQGAEIIDIGGQSTRPGHIPVTPEEEWERLRPVLEALHGSLKIPVSVDTYYTEVGRAALSAGASILNDVSGGIDNGMIALAAEAGAAIVAMYPGRTETEPADEPILHAVRRWFDAMLAEAERVKLPLSSLCLDPGIGFCRTRPEDLELIAELPQLKKEYPETALLVGASRKRVVGEYCGNPPFDQRLAGTLALHTASQLGGAEILRVHDVAEAVQAARVTDALLAVRNTK